MIVITVFFKLEHPFNADMVMIMILKLCSLDFINAESLLKTLFDFRETGPFDEEITETGQVKSKFLDAGYESVIYIALLGPFFFFLIATLLFIFFKLLLKKIFKRCRDSCMRRYFMQSFNVRMIILRLIMESSFEIGLSAMITVLMVSIKTNFETLSNSLFVTSYSSRKRVSTKDRKSSRQSLHGWHFWSSS